MDITKLTAAGFTEYLMKMKYVEKRGEDLEHTTKEITEKLNKSYQESITRMLELANERTNIIDLIKVIQTEYKKAKGDVIEYTNDEETSEQIPTQIKTSGLKRETTQTAS